MLRPVRMTLVNVLLLKEDEPVVLRALAEAECLEVESSRLTKGSESLSACDTRAASQGLNSLASRMAQVARDLRVFQSEPDTSGLRIDPLNVAAIVEAEFAPVETEARQILDQIAEGEKTRARADLLSWVIAGLDGMGVDMLSVVDTKYVAVELGAVPSHVYPRLRDSLAVGGHHLFVLGDVGVRSVVCAVTQPNRRQDLLDVLNAARFERVDVAKDLVAEGKTSADLSEIALWEVKERIADAGVRLAHLAAKWGPPLARCRREVEVNIQLLARMEHFLEGSYTRLVTGWMPTERLGELESALEGRTAGRVQVVPLDEAMRAPSPSREIVPPTKLSNHPLIKPWQLLVEFYGSPAYDSIDPTSFVAFTFALIFGAMFGDAGQGFVLACLGGAACYWARKGTVLKDVGAILTWCGSTSIIFGFIYGSFFGFEFERISLLGFSFRTIPPMANPTAFLAAAVIVGVVVINLGLIINLAQHLWAGKYKEAFLGEWGATTLAFYWGVVALFYLAASGHSSIVTLKMVAIVLGPPLFLTTFGTEIYNMIMREKGEYEMAGLFIKPMELMMGSLSNTISFMRVSAFALNHAALMGTVFVFAKLVGGPSIVGSTFSALDVVTGNIMVMVLEGIMVFAQTMRLHYYEFFSKFFLTQGRPFEPLSLRAGRSGI